MTHINTEGLIPNATQTAARRALIRTFSQSLSSALAIGGVTLALDAEWWLKAIIFVGGVLLTAAIAGLSAYFNVLAKGLPEDYVAADSTTGSSPTVS